MSAITSILQDEILSSTLQKGFYALAACTVIGTAAYIGYKAAGSEAKQTLHNRRPELNEQVNKINLKIFFLSHLSRLSIAVCVSCGILVSIVFCIVVIRAHDLLRENYGPLKAKKKRRE